MENHTDFANMFLRCLLKGWHPGNSYRLELRPRLVGRQVSSQIQLPPAGQPKPG